MENNDLISRKALLEAFSADTQHLRCWDDDLYDLMVAEIEDAPAVETNPVRHGRWIPEGGLDEDGNGQYRCSQCGAGEKHNPNVAVSYCWNCGTKMDLEKPK